MDDSTKNAILFNCMSYMSDKLLNQRNTYAFFDEFYLFLSSQVSVVYVRNAMKRSRKYDSGVCIATQNIEDFMDPAIMHQTKPMLALGTHQFIFNVGNIDGEQFSDMMQLEPKEYQIIRNGTRGHCLYRCGNERFSLQVHFPDYKTKLYGSAGGR